MYETIGKWLVWRERFPGIFLRSPRGHIIYVAPGELEQYKRVLPKYVFRELRRLFEAPGER